MMTADWIEKVEKKTSTIGIGGLGYGGLPLALRYSDIGYRVLGFDIHAGKVARLNAGKTLIEHIPSSAIAAACAAGFSATTDFARVRSEEHTSELQSLMRISYAVFCLKKKR